jgi:MFS family permease
MSPFVHLTIVSIVMAGVLAVVTRNLLPTDEDGHGDEPAPEPSDARRRASRAPLVLLVLAGVFAVLLEVTGGDWATFRLTDDFGATAAVASLAFVAYSVGMAAMRFGGDFLQLRLGRMGLHRLSVAIATVGFVVATLIPLQTVSIIGFFLIGLGVATFMPKLYDDAARLPGRRGAGLGAMTAGMRIAFLLTPVIVGGLAGTSLSVGQAVAIYSLPAAIGLVVVTEWNERLLRRTNAGPRAAH